MKLEQLRTSRRRAHPALAIVGRLVTDHPTRVARMKGGTDWLFGTTEHAPQQLDSLPEGKLISREFSNVHVKMVPLALLDRHGGADAVISDGAELLQFGTLVGQS